MYPMHLSQNERCSYRRSFQELFWVGPEAHLGGRADLLETSCACGAPLLMKRDRLEPAATRREDDQWYTCKSVPLKLYTGVWTNHSL